VPTATLTPVPVVLDPGGLKESLLRRESGTVANPQNAANKVIIAQIAAPMMQSNSNIEQTITRLNNAGINFTEKEIATAFEDTIISFKLKAHQALLYAGSMAQLSQIERKTTTKQITQSTQSQNQVTEQIIAVLNGLIDSKLDELSFDNVIMSSGISAGDEFKPKLQGAWIRGTCGASKDNGTFSYIGNIAGATIGSDFELNEQTVVGAAYSNMSTAFKHKKNYAGDKTNSNSHILSLYGAYQLNDNISVKTMLSVGMSNIATKRSILNNIASGKIKNKNYNAKTSVSYNFKATENIYLVPNLGLAYSHSSDDAYSEKGAGVHNISIKTKSNNNLTAIAVLNAIMPHKISNTLSIAPSIHASVESHLWNKKSKVKAKLAWMDDYFSKSLKANKTERFSYNIGGGITTQRDNIEIAMNYNCNIRQKYQNHQGSIKLKLAF
jgi:outer membrane autotransporter protein